MEKIKQLNNLLKKEPEDTLLNYALALEYAPKNFGFKTTYIDLYYAPKSFYAIMVTYQNEESISILLYSKHIEHQLNINENTQSDINVLLDSSIEYFTMHKQAKIKLYLRISFV